MRNRLLLCCVVVWMSVFVNGQTIGKMTVEGRVEPRGLDAEVPRFGWQITSTKRNVVQVGYQIQVSTTAEGKGDVWDSGFVASDSSQWVSFKGKALKPNTVYYWRVRLKTNRGDAGWSRCSTWTTGLLSEKNWSGEWIGYDSLTPDVKMEQHSRIAVRHFRKDFTIQRPVKRATVHVCGLGYYILLLNGQRIGDYLLAPPPTQYDKVAMYDSYDVTEVLNGKGAGSGDSRIEVMLAGGYFFPMTQNFQTNVRSAFGMPKLKLNLCVEYENESLTPNPSPEGEGSRMIIATDSTWMVANDGPIHYANLYDGTLIDYNYQPTEWKPVQMVDAPCLRLRGNSLGGVKAYGTEKCKSMKCVGKNRYILDFGTNNTGRVYLPAVTIGKGDTVRIRYAETLKADGELYTDNLRHAQNTDYFVGNGQRVDMTTEFLWHGFRYMELCGLDEADARRITRQLMTDDLISTASVNIREGNGMVNRILENARRGILSNYKGIPMDCPQRDERMPWLGDRTMGCFGESYLTHNHSLYEKWLNDICDAQLENGSISDVSPSYWRLYNGNITWPAALPFGMEMMWLQYGDDRPAMTHYDNVKRFLQFAKQKSGKDGLITYDRYGDWCVPPATLDEVVTKDTTRMTNGTLISSAYYYYICRQIARWADMKQLENDKTYFETEANETKAAINQRFLKNGCYANGTVTANLLPLTMDIVPETDRQAVQESFMKRVRGESGSPHIDCGVIGISWLMRYLTKAGLGDVAYQIASTNTYPGWGYMVENGATTIWELWNGNTANPSMNSGNHVMMLGDLIPWIFECLAGIAPDATQPGFKHIVMRPDFSINPVHGVAATYPSIYGDICSEWERKNGKIIWTVDIPANTTATLYLPNGKVKKLGSGKYRLKVKSEE